MKNLIVLFALLSAACSMETAPEQTSPSVVHTECVSIVDQEMFLLGHMTVSQVRTEVVDCTAGAYLTCFAPNPTSGCVGPACDYTPKSYEGFCRVARPECSGETCDIKE